MLWIPGPALGGAVESPGYGISHISPSIEEKSSVARLSTKFAIVVANHLQNVSQFRLQSVEHSFCWRGKRTHNKTRQDAKHISISAKLQ